MNKQDIIDKINKVRNNFFDDNGNFTNVHQRIKEISELRSKLKEIDDE